MRRAIRRLLLWKLIMLAVRIGPWDRRKWVTNRAHLDCKVGDIQVSICLRDTAKPDGYSREELIAMLREIRAEERRTGWKAPEA